MFTGVVQDLGKVVGVAGSAAGMVLRVDLGDLARRVQLGGSVAVNGVCLTVTAIDQRCISFDVIGETRDLTNLGRVRVGQMVNLELPLRGSDPIDGHFVLGHVDGLARLKSHTVGHTEHVMWFTVAQELARYLLPKGSVALDGVSLTIVQVDGQSFSVALIPATLESTTLGGRSMDDMLNIETDYLAKVILSGLDNLTSGSDESLLKKLRSAGFTDL